ncbi:MAG: hypothetical protein ABR615_07555 [Pseudonocardiaceae bacterium]
MREALADPSDTIAYPVPLMVHRLAALPYRPVLINADALRRVTTVQPDIPRYLRSRASGDRAAEANIRNGVSKCTVRGMPAP